MFALEFFIGQMKGKANPVDEYPKARQSLPDEGRIVVHAITTKLETYFRKATLGLPGETPEEQLKIRLGYRKLASRSSQFPYQSCRYGLVSLRANPVERLHIPLRERE